MILDVMVNNGETYYGTLCIKEPLETPFESANDRLFREVLTKFPTLKGRNDIMLCTNA